MQQVTRQQIKLFQKAKLVLCAKHLETLVSINITPNCLLGGRTICDQCQIRGQQILSFPDVEDIIYQLWCQQQQYKDNSILENTSYKNLLNLFCQFEKCLEQRMLKMKELITKVFQECYKVNQIQHQPSQLEMIVNQLINDEPITRVEIEKIAEFTSQKYINGQIIVEKTNNQGKLQKYQEIIENIELCLKNGIIQYGEYSQKQDNVINIDRLEPVYSLELTQNQQYIIASYPSSIKIWNIQSKEKIQEYDATQYPQTIAISNDDTLLAGEGQDQHIIYCWNIKLNQRNPSIKFKGHLDKINKLIFSFDSQYLFSASRDNTIKMWSIKSKELSWSIQTNTTIMMISISTQFLGAIFNDGYINLWVLMQDFTVEKQNKIQWQVDDYKGVMVEFAHNSSLVLTTGHDLILKLWDIIQKKSDPKAKPIAIYQGHKSNVSSFRYINTKFSQDDSIIYSVCSSDDSIIIWDVKSRLIIQKIKIPFQFQTFILPGLAISKNNNQLITGNFSGKIQIFQKYYY